MSARGLTELLEARAERGTHRGAEVVWRNATAAAEPSAEWNAGRRTVGGFGSSGWFRLAVGVLAIVVAASIGLLVDRDGPDAGEPIATGPAESEVDGSDSNDSPRRILIDGMDMSWAYGPADPDFAGDDDLLDAVVNRVTPSDQVTPTPPAGVEPAEQVIFADPTDPFANPILGIDPLDGGGFRPWGMNLGEMTLEQLTESLDRTDGEWTVGEDSGLVEVARISVESYDQLVARFGWQFDFRSGSDGAIWQAEPHNDAGVWLWIARLSGTSTEPLTSTVRDASVLGQPGIVVEQSFGTDPSTDPDRRSYVLWVDGDFVYRLTAARIEGDTSYGADPVPVLPRLSIVDDQTWDDEVANANSMIRAVTVVTIVNVTLLGLWAMSSLYFLIFGPRFLALWVVVAVGFWILYSPSLPSTAVLAAGLVAIWLWRRRWLRNTRAVEKAVEQVL